MKHLTTKASPYTYETVSALLSNPGKMDLSLAPPSVWDFNSLKYESGVSYAHKAMVLCYLGKPDNGIFDTRKFFGIFKTSSIITVQSFTEINHLRSTTNNVINDFFLS